MNPRATRANVKAIESDIRQAVLIALVSIEEASKRPDPADYADGLRVAVDTLAEKMDSLSMDLQQLR
jgi:hypothetical protein